MSIRSKRLQFHFGDLWRQGSGTHTCSRFCALVRSVRESKYYVTREPAKRHRKSNRLNSPSGESMNARASSTSQVSQLLKNCHWCLWMIGLLPYILLGLQSFDYQTSKLRIPRELRYPESAIHKIYTQHWNVYARIPQLEYENRRTC